MATKIRLPNNWKPREDQLPLWCYLENGGRHAVEVAHRRWGKDDVALHHTACASMQRIGNYWHMLPQYSQARKAIWEAVNPRTGKRRIDEAFPLEIRKTTRNQEMMIPLINGSSWQLVGSDNFDSLVGSPPIGVVYSEYALADPRARAYLSPILLENEGWELFIYTPRGMNHGKTLLDFARQEDGWFGQLLTVADTPVFTQKQLDATHRELLDAFGDAEGEALFQQEYYCSFQGAVLGAYYAKQMALARKEGRITKVPYNPAFQVFTFWDLGFDDSTTIWFIQMIGKAHHVIDYYENSNESMEHYARILREKRYNYGDHYMPHDVEHHGIGILEGKSIKEVAESTGIEPIITVQRARDSKAVREGIEASRNILASCWFDEKKCHRGISCLEGYQAEYNDARKKLADRPLHNWCSHGADGFRTFAVGYAPKKPVVTVSSILDRLMPSFIGGPS